MTSEQASTQLNAEELRFMGHRLFSLGMAAISPFVSGGSLRRDDATSRAQLAQALFTGSAQALALFDNLLRYGEVATPKDLISRPADESSGPRGATASG